MKPFSELFESSAAHGLLLHMFYQQDDMRWSACWRAAGDDGERRISARVFGDEPYETLSRSLMVAIADLAPTMPAADDTQFW